VHTNPRLRRNRTDPHSSVAPRWCTAMQKLRIELIGISGARRPRGGRFATPADSPLHDCSPYRGLHVRRESLGVVPHSRTLSCRPVPTLNFTWLARLAHLLPLAVRALRAKHHYLERACERPAVSGRAQLRRPLPYVRFCRVRF
jgi:hypothetical protein